MTKGQACYPRLGVYLRLFPELPSYSVSATNKNASLRSLQSPSISHSLLLLKAKVGALSENHKVFH